MRKLDLKLGGTLLVLFFLAGTALAQGPLGTYYLTAGDQGTNWRISGLTATSSAQANSGNGGEYAIAVTSSFVRTLHNGNDPTQGPGSEYDLSFAYTGNNYTFGQNLQFYDGTSDGTNFYSVNYTNGDVYRMTSSWTSPTIIFNTGFGSSNSLGITYDSRNNSLWISEWGGVSVTQFSLAGAVLSAFNSSTNATSALAYNPLSDTLWMGTQNNQGEFREYSKTGTLLQTQSYGSMGSQNTLGGEFATAAIPEPSTLLLGGMAVLGAAGTYWSKRRRLVKNHR